AFIGRDCDALIGLAVLDASCIGGESYHADSTDRQNSFLTGNQIEGIFRVSKSSIVSRFRKFLCSLPECQQKSVPPHEYHMVPPRMAWPACADLLVVRAGDYCRVGRSRGWRVNGRNLHVERERSTCPHPDLESHGGRDPPRNQRVLPEGWHE